MVDNKESCNNYRDLAKNYYQPLTSPAMFCPLKLRQIYDLLNLSLNPQGLPCEPGMTSTQTVFSQVQYSVIQQVGMVLGVRL